MTITVLGSINIDITAYSERLPRPGETISGNSYILGLGGKGANQAVAASRLGARTIFVGRAGDDSFAAAAVNQLEGFGVGANFILRDRDSSTGIAIIGVERSGENAITIVSGANMKHDAREIERARAELGHTKVLLLQLETPLGVALDAARIVRAAGGLVVLDPAPAPAGGIGGDVLANIDLITPNETETSALTGILPSSADEGITAARKLRALGAAGAIVKLGARGVSFSTADDEGFVPPFKVTPIDTVAAGDCFNGGLAAALADGMPIAAAVRFAAACGALSTTRKGAAASAPSRGEVEALLAAG